MENRHENPISLRSKHWLSDALVELMREKPYEKIAIKEVAEKADLTRQTFYHNFDSKEELLIYKSDLYFEEFFRNIFNSSVSNINDFLVYFFRYWQENADFIRLLLKNNKEHILIRRSPEYISVLKLLDLKDKLKDRDIEYIYTFCAGAVIHTLC
ncbi:MAG: TetR/AcrR family transcriptional regulator, partial [Oscillospiraceae bacterium]|nr:TetR/AcrR family transcriptional regulator [Oscillospiraceae bacterium]